jgi:hypothetical protein
MKKIIFLFLFSAAVAQEPVQPADQLSAGQEILYIQRLLEKGRSNIVREILEFPFYENDHYPKGDVIDETSKSQYYYHAHREGEHGHFHVFYKEKGKKPVHLVAISMDSRGVPIGLFTTNRWVTGEEWHSADEICKLLPHFQIELPHPSWLANRWVTAMVRLFYPQIVKLVHLRDKKIAEWMRAHPGSDVYEDRDLEITSEMTISVENQVAAVHTKVQKKL